MTHDPDGAPPLDFIALTRRYLCDEYPRKLRLTLDRLPEEELWWRPNDQSNSVGNLLLHLAGNVRQWVVSGVGRQADVRDRPGEFAARSGTRDELLSRLDQVLAEVALVLEDLDPSQLDETRAIQGLEVGVREALYHVVEHFSMHLGQIMWIVKARAGTDLGLYSVDSGGRVTGTNW